MAKRFKLICDRCGREVSDEADVELILDGAEAWQASVRAGGAEPRGVFPCQDFARCHGEMKIAIEDRRSRREKKPADD